MQYLYDDDAGARYALYVQEILAELADRERQISSFVHESLLGCGGQIVLPDGYFQEAYRCTREAGGICIADEVQVGFGRVGTHFWGFQTQELSQTLSLWVSQWVTVIRSPLS